MTRIARFETYDVRFPTSATLDGSDAMNPSPDYAAAYVVVRTTDESVSGHGFVFTIGRGNDVELAAIRALEPLVAGLDLDGVLGDLGGMSRRLVGDSQLRWLGPEKGVMHMAIGAVLNALFDLAAKRAGLPLWKWLAGLAPAELLDFVDLRYLTDVLPRSEALEILEEGKRDVATRVALLEADGVEAYTTSPGWLGYSDERLRALLAEAKQDGFAQVKMKIGKSLDDDIRRLGLARELLGPSTRIAVDANQVFETEQAIAWAHALERFDIAWLEEPTSPDDILATAAIRRAVAPMPVAAGEHVANRVVFKQLLQAGAIDVMQIDACRVAGVPENIVNLLLAAKFNVPVCPHAGGVGLCEAVQHLAFFDYAAISGHSEHRRVEWIDHLHEHFVSPAAVAHGRYVAPGAPGASTEMHQSSLEQFSFPGGPAWSPAPAGASPAPVPA